MTYNQVLKFCGSPQAMADLANVTDRSVANWHKEGRIPLKQQAYIEMRSGGVLKAVGIKRWRK